MRFSRVHLLGWLIIAALMFLQDPGRTAADTKLDLHLNPAGFLADATHAWTDEFTLGQVQNQAYGYLFPQGPFFLVTDWLPDWVAQRFWWTIVVGVGFSGFLVLAHRIGVGSPLFRVIAAGLFALSPRTLTTLTAISSETWPVMLAPWVLAAVVEKRLGWGALARALIPVGLMGAVNATATLAACLPAGIALTWRLTKSSERAQTWRFAAWWLLGCALVSAWWIGPLLVLGRYAAPFTEFIESAAVTTRWLNLPEILRGTTSWSPFVDAERTAGFLLVVEPVFVLATMAVAALGLIGLIRGVPQRGLWVTMLLTGVLILGLGQGPLAQPWLTLLDGPLAPFRNLHKFDPLVRIPLLLGVAALGSVLPAPRLNTRSGLATALVLVVALAATAPAWSGRLAPRGTWEEVPDYWYHATDYLNEHAAGTRTLIVPEASFARQEWGWTRDEPAQPLLEVPFAVRDAIPLITPEAIRDLDGIMTALHHDPEEGVNALRRVGVGALLIRHDLESDQDPIDLEPTVSFGEVDIVLLDTTADLAITDADPVTVSGGGESLALLDMLHGPGPRVLTPAGGEIVTDTPMAVARNYGTLDGPVSAPLAPGDPTYVTNRLIDYPSTGQRSVVMEHGARVSASSSAADANSFGGADPARSVTAAVDGHEDTAWWPTPGPGEGQWLQLDGTFPDQARLTVTATAATSVRIVNGEAAVTVDVDKDTPRTVTVPGPASGTIRVELTQPAPVGISELSVRDVPIERVVTVPPASDATRMILLQRLAVDTKVIIRDITLTRPTTFVLAGDAEINGEELIDGAELTLDPGTHRVVSEDPWITLTEPGFDPSPAFTDLDGRQVPVSDADQLLLTGRAANDGLRAHLDGIDLEPRVVDAGTQAFVIPAGVGGTVTFSFAGDGPYRTALVLGGLMAVVTMLFAVVGAYRFRRVDDAYVDRRDASAVFTIVVLAVVAGWAGVAAAAVVWAIRRWTVFSPALLAGVFMAIAGAWLARGPWPTSNYAGDDGLMAGVCAAALACLVADRLRTHRRAGSSTK